MLQQNSFLAALSASDLDLLRPSLTKITLCPGDHLQQFDRPVEHVIFLYSSSDTDEVRTDHQPQDREGTRPCHPVNASSDRRRSDRITILLAASPNHSIA
jgi:hypothetical protein